VYVCITHTLPACLCVCSTIFVKADLIKDELKGHLDGKERTPGWVKALDWPGETADMISDKIEVRAQQWQEVCLAGSHSMQRGSGRRSDLQTLTACTEAVAGGLSCRLSQHAQAAKVGCSNGAVCAATCFHLRASVDEYCGLVQGVKRERGNRPSPNTVDSALLYHPLLLQACWEGMFTCCQKKEKAKFQRTSTLEKAQEDPQVQIQVEGEQKH